MRRSFRSPRRRPRFGPAGSAVACVLACGLLVGCAGSGRHVVAGGSSTSPASGGGSSAPSGSGGSADAPCREWSCTPGQPVQLGDGYSVRLWSSAAPTGLPAPDRSTPVVELLRDGGHVQWWQGRSGFGWQAALTCRPASDRVAAHCAVLAEVGSHAGLAQLVLLRSGTLTGPSQASVSFDGGRPVAADLDGDGWLDVLGVENDYQPNYATGHNFWATYRFDGTGLQRTGCTPRPTPATPVPDRLLTGSCPVVAGA
ncbi:MAG: VCBS repeat-containing protein [Actinobacteria bacterium]|nr:VCBS repeat-containing protein [Actinomycetota bacterium]